MNTEEREGKVDNDVLSFMERDSLTVWGDAFSAQSRDRGELALHIMEDAPRSTEDDHPVLLGPKDVAKLRALLNEIEAREGA